MENTPNIGQSLDLTTAKRRELQALVPEAFTEGKLDVAALQRALGDQAVVDSGERYALSWAGKANAYKVLQSATTATLRPQREQSVNFDDAQHVFIEGENLEVLKVLQKAYFGKVKIVYIDPPYNTGSDKFIYPDRFQESKEDYLSRVNDLSDDGTLMREGFFQQNSKENGHYHSNWLSMMLPRLYIARNLLRNDGVILVSIDDHEAANLKLLMDEVFGPENFAAQLVWEKGRKNDAKLVSVGHEYILVYLRNRSFIAETGITWREAKPGTDEIYTEYLRLRQEHGRDNEVVEQGIRSFYESLPKTHPSKKHSRYGRVDDNGVWRDDNMSWPGGGGPTYDVLHPVTAKPCVVPDGGWRYSTLDKMNEMIEKGKVVFREDHTQPPIRKTYLVRGHEDEDEEVGEIEADDIGLQVAGSYFYRSAIQASNELTKLFGGRIFENSKDHEVLARWILYVGSPQRDDIVVDFFSGSGTTAQAVMQLNKDDAGRRQVICVQLPESVEERSTAYKAGFKTVADISRERIRRIIEKIKTELALTDPAVASLGFKSFILSPSNFKQWRGDGIEDADALADQIKMFMDSEKAGARPEDILYELLLKFGQLLTTPIEHLEVNGVPIVAVNERKMLFVIEDFTPDMIEPLLGLLPREIVALDSVFHDSDELKSNLDLQCRDAEVQLTCV